MRVARPTEREVEVTIGNVDGAVDGNLRDALTDPSFVYLPYAVFDGAGEIRF